MPSPPRLLATASQTIGPFFHVVPGCADGLACLVTPSTSGERIDLRVRVLDGDGAPVSDALIELWQPDAAGTYASSREETPPDERFTGFGRRSTDEEGWATFQTIRPGAVPGGDVNGSQAPHVDVVLFARGLLRHLRTRLYFEGDPWLGSDPLLSIVPEDRRPTLLARAAGGAIWEFVIRLQGPAETVFFDA